MPSHNKVNEPSAFPLEQLAYLITEPRRLDILSALVESKEPLTPSLLAAKLKLKEDRVSRHLKYLRETELVVCLPSGRHMLYSPNRRLLTDVANFLTSRLVHKD